MLYWTTIKWRLYGIKEEIWKNVILPTRDLIIFPGVVTPIYIGRKDSLTTLEEAVKNKNKLILGLQKDPNVEEPDLDKDIYKVGILVSVLQVIKMPNNNIKVLQREKAE